MWWFCRWFVNRAGAIKSVHVITHWISGMEGAVAPEISGPEGVAARELLERQLPFLAGYLSKHGCVLDLTFYSELPSYQESCIFVLVEFILSWWVYIYEASAVFPVTHCITAILVLRDSPLHRLLPCILSMCMASPCREEQLVVECAPAPLKVSHKSCTHVRGDTKSDMCLSKHVYHMAGSIPCPRQS
jgi:hypothetical protein